MDCECMSKRMRRDRFGETGPRMRFLAGCFYRETLLATADEVIQ
jgi:hypothetical protein